MSDETLQTPEKLKGLEELLLQASEMDEVRMQRMLPGKREPGYYLERSRGFYDQFSKMEGCETVFLDRCVAIGDPRYLKEVGEIVEQRLAQINAVTDVEIPQILVFVGNGKIMIDRYVGKDFGIRPTPFAINGARTCYINTDYPDRLGITHPAVIRAVIHEPSHPAFNQSIVGLNGLPTFQLDDKDKVITEALAGPNDPELWADLPLPAEMVLDFEPLERGKIDFYGWLDKVIEKYNIRVPYFLNPAVAEFYRWAAKQGDARFWYQKALDLEPTE